MNYLTAINANLNEAGVTTWFFPDDSKPCDKLHRMMHVGVNKYHRVLLICSEASLSRAGVLNELERLLGREAKQGAADILIPLTIDDYVFGRWKLSRLDVADQVRFRVISRIPDPKADPEGLGRKMLRVQAALRKDTTF